LKRFELVAKIAQSPQTIIDIEKSRLPAHRFIPDTVKPKESENRMRRQVFRTVQL
jgi:hypothetical protein